MLSNINTLTPVSAPQDMLPSLKYLQQVRGFMEKVLGKHISSIVVDDVIIDSPDLKIPMSVSVIRFYPQFNFSAGFPIKGVKYLDIFVHPVDKFPAFCLRSEEGVTWGRFDTQDDPSKYVPVFMEASFNGLDPKSRLKTLLHFSYTVN